jgi:D-alanyl-D-alanine-carboxypeptidase/D-alanyl-D-alanine-endopeptidase
VPDWHLGALAGAGALWSTAEDQLRFLRAHLHPDETPIAPALRLVQQPRFSASKRLRIGLGWHLSPLVPHDRMAGWHNGGTGGFRSFVAFVPESDVGVVVLANSVRSVDGLGSRLLRRVGGLVEPVA